MPGLKDQSDSSVKRGKSVAAKSARVAVGATVGWREWVQLPRLGVGPIVAKIDTGARTSALHATHVEIIEQDGRQWARFRLYDDHRNPAHYTIVKARVRDIRGVRNSGGVQEQRVVIRTALAIGASASAAENSFIAEFTLVERSDMIFPMLLGRTALRANKWLVNPGRSFLMGRNRRQS